LAQALGFFLAAPLIGAVLVPLRECGDMAETGASGRMEIVEAEGQDKAEPEKIGAAQGGFPTIAAVPTQDTTNEKIAAEGNADDGSVMKPKRSSKIQVDTNTKEEHPPIRYVTFMADHPKKAMSLACCCCFPFFILLNVILFSVTGGVFFSVVFPFYVKGHIKYERKDALIQAKKDASATPPAFEQATKINPRQVEAYQFKILYEAPPGRSIFQKEYIMKIAEIEGKIMAATGENMDKKVKGYEDYCQVQYNSGVPMNSPCRTPMSIIGFLDASWIPLPYTIMPPASLGNTPIKPSQWTSPNTTLNPGLDKCTVVPVQQSWTFANPTADVFERTVGVFLPAGVAPMTFLAAMNDDSTRCSMGQTVMSGLTCSEVEACAPLIWNMVTMTLLWGYTQNQHFSYANTSANFDSNIDKFKDYWSKYGGAPTSSLAYSSANAGNYAPFVLGVIVDAGNGPSARRLLVPKVLSNPIRMVAGGSFGYPAGGGSTTGRAVISTFSFGSPLSNINSKWTTVPAEVDCDENSGQCMEETDITKWMLNSWGQMLLDIHHQEKDAGGLTITWQSKDVLNNDEPLKSSYTQTVLMQDMKFIILAVLFVWGYIVFMKRSIFLATFAIIMIFGSVLPTMVLYQVVCQQTFVGVLQMLSMFIIMGIGADDVFVLLDCYQQDRNFERPLRQDLSASWRHAAKAMACTSATTFFSFLANGISVFPAIQTFGLWCSCLIVVNFVHVNFFYLAVVSVYDRYFAQKQMICCCFKPTQPPPDAPANQVEQLEGQERQEGNEFKGVPKFLADRYFPVIDRFKIPIVILWVLLAAMYVAFAAQIKPDPEPPQMMPEADPYQMFNAKLVDHFAAQSESRVKVQIVAGIDADVPIDREGTDDVKMEDRGKVNWRSLVPPDNAALEDLQKWLADDDGICAALRAKSGDSALQIATKEQVSGEDPVKCPWTVLKAWVLARGETWPRPDFEAFSKSIDSHMLERNTLDPSKTNYETYWKDRVLWVPKTAEEGGLGGVEPKLFTLEVWLSADRRMDFNDGNKLSDDWQTFLDEWIAKAPAYLRKSIYFTDKSNNGGGAFHYFVLQETIIKECFQGIGISLALAFCVLLAATRNIIVAGCSIACIASIVTSVIAFSHWCGWKLGLMEAIIFVMVIGLSVDYVVHMADAYLEAHALDRKTRARFMCGKMGLSVISGAATTVGSSLMMCLTYILFFKKFGLVILWTITQSVITAIVFFVAMMALFGPEGNFGRVDRTVFGLFPKKPT